MFGVALTTGSSALGVVSRSSRLSAVSAACSVDAILLGGISPVLFSSVWIENEQCQNFAKSLNAVWYKSKVDTKISGSSTEAA